MKFSKMKMILIASIALTLSACSNTVLEAGETHIPTEEEALATAQVGVATQKQILATMYFQGVADCKKEKDFVFTFKDIECPENGCSMALNGAKKKCDSVESRQTFMIAMNSIKQPKSKAGFYDFAIAFSGDLKDATVGALDIGKDIITSNNAGLFFVAKAMTDLGEKVGDRDSNNTTINEQNTSIAKNAGADLLDDGSTKDASTTSSVANTEDISGTKVLGNYDAHVEQNSAVHDESIENSNNPITSTEIKEAVEAPVVAPEPAEDEVE